MKNETEQFFELLKNVKWFADCYGPHAPFGPGLKSKAMWTTQEYSKSDGISHRCVTGKVKVYSDDSGAIVGISLHDYSKQFDEFMQKRQEEGK